MSNENANAAEGEEDVTMQVELSLDILAQVKAAQSTNGLRHSDYRRYRQYCARRLRRIRCNKSIKFMYGRSKNFVQRVMTPEVRSQVLKIVK